MEKKEFITKLLTVHDTVAEIERGREKLLSLIPELGSMIGFEHCHPHHHLNVWEHTLLALSYSENRLETRLALLLHDIGKPFSYQQDGEFRHFKGHAEKSAQMTEEILYRLGFDAFFTERVTEIVRRHDTPLTEEDISVSQELSSEIFEVQKCDALAHNPLYNKKRITYIDTVRKLMDGAGETI